MCERSSILAAFGGDNSQSSQNLVLAQLLGHFRELLLPSSRSRSVAILDPSHASH